MRRCLYCQHTNPAAASDCNECGMPLPARAEQASEDRQRRFMWFCLGLTLFCVSMFFWLPRSIY